MEENKVVMKLEDYTRLIIENTTLRNTLKGLALKVRTELGEKIYTSKINGLNREQTIALIDEKDPKVLADKVGTYSYSIEYVENYGVFSTSDLYVMFAEEVKKIANEHLYNLDHAGESGA